MADKRGKHLLKKCSADEAALKSFFLGPQAENSDWVMNEVDQIMAHWFNWRKSLNPHDGTAISEADIQSEEFKLRRQVVHRQLKELFLKFEKEIPQFSPRYIGHMYSEISLPALFGHLVALLHNPNNLSSEAAKVGTLIEQEAIIELKKMIGFSDIDPTGHFTSGGTIANFEGLWRARFRMDHWLSLGSYLNENFSFSFSYHQAGMMGWKKFYELKDKYQINDEHLKSHSGVALSPWKVFDKYTLNFRSPFKGPVILIPSSKHYSWLKGVSLLGFGEECFWPVQLSEKGSLCILDLENKINKAISQDRPIMMITSIAGTTELGICDPISEINSIVQKYRNQGIDIWHHVDAAYGGYFCTVDFENNFDYKKVGLENYHDLRFANSVTLDPHKLGYVPYACGAFLASDEENYVVAAFEAKYLQSLSGGSEKWMKTIEGSRSAAGATATWMTAKTVGLNGQGYGKILARSIRNKMILDQKLATEIPEIYVLDQAQVNLSALLVRGTARTMSEANDQTKKLILAIEDEGQFIVSSTVLKSGSYKELIKSIAEKLDLRLDTDEVQLLRMTLMNPFFQTKETQVNFLDAFVKHVQLLTSKIIASY